MNADILFDENLLNVCQNRMVYIVDFAGDANVRSRDITVTRDATISGNVTITQNLFQGSQEINNQRRWEVDLTGQSSSNFYPVELAHPYAIDFNLQPVHFKVSGESLAGADSYNESTLVGYARGGGYSDHLKMYDVHYRRFDYSEVRYLGVYQGTQSYIGGIVIYMRGGYKYSVITDAPEVNTNTSAVALSNAVFAIKNVSNADVSGTSANIERMVDIANCTQPDRRFFSGGISSTSYLHIGTVPDDLNFGVNVEASGAGPTNGIKVRNPTDSSGQDACLSIQVAGGSSGDPYVTYDVSGVNGWSAGVDTSDGQKYKLSRVWNGFATSSNDMMVLDRNGHMQIKSLEEAGSNTHVRWSSTDTTRFPQNPASVTYYKLATLGGLTNGSNGGAICIKGTLGGYVENYLGQIDCTISTRGSTGYPVVKGTIDGQKDSIATACNITVYEETGGGFTVWLSVASYYSFDFVIIGGDGANASTHYQRRVFDYETSGGAGTPTGTLRTYVLSELITQPYKKHFASITNSNYMWLGKFRCIDQVMIRVNSSGNARYNSCEYRVRRQYGAWPVVDGVSGDHFDEHTFFWQADASNGYEYYDLWMKPNHVSNPAGNFTFIIDTDYYSLASGEPTNPTLKACDYGLLTRHSPDGVYNGHAVGDYGNVSRVGIGTANPYAPLHVEDRKSATAGIGPAQKGVYVTNANNSANEDATVTIRTAGSSAGDPFLSYDIKNEFGWSVGMDNDNGNQMTWSTNWADLSAAGKMFLNTNGHLSLNYNLGTGNVVSDLYKFLAYDSFDGSGGTKIVSHNYFSDLGLNFCGASIGQKDASPYARFGLRVFDALVHNGGYALVVRGSELDGRVGIGTASPNHKLEVNDNAQTVIRIKENSVQSTTVGATGTYGYSGVEFMGTSYQLGQIIGVDTRTGGPTWAPSSSTWLSKIQMNSAHHTHAGQFAVLDSYGFAVGDTDSRGWSFSVNGRYERDWSNGVWNYGRQSAMALYGESLTTGDYLAFGMYFPGTSTFAGSFFLNGSTRYADGGPSALTVRNDTGRMHVGNDNHVTHVHGSQILFGAMTGWYTNGQSTFGAAYGKFHFKGSTGTNFSSANYFYANSNGSGNITGALTNYSIGIFMDGGDIITNYSLFAHAGTASASDERIKRDIVDLDDGEALTALRLIQPKRYKYKDVVRRGDEEVYGFIAQQVKECMPYAVGERRDVLPNIQVVATAEGANVLRFPDEYDTSELSANTTIRVVAIRTEETHDIEITEVVDAHRIRVDVEDLDALTGDVDEEGNVVFDTHTEYWTEDKFLNESDHEGVVASNLYQHHTTNVLVSVETWQAMSDDERAVHSEVTGYTKTWKTYPGDKLYVYGYYVDDFHFLKKDYIWTVATAALQEVDRQLQAERDKVATLQGQMADLLARVAALEA
jgi:hypothetical protein